MCHNSGDSHCSAATCLPLSLSGLNSFSSANLSLEALPASPATCCTCAPSSDLFLDQQCKPSF